MFSPCNNNACTLQSFSPCITPLSPLPCFSRILFFFCSFCSSFGLTRFSLLPLAQIYSPVSPDDFPLHFYPPSRTTNRIPSSSLLPLFPSKLGGRVPLATGTEQGQKNKGKKKNLFHWLVKGLFSAPFVKCDYFIVT